MRLTCELWRRSSPRSPSCLQEVHPHCFKPQLPLPARKLPSKKRLLGKQARVCDAMGSKLFVCPWCVVSSQLGDEELEEADVPQLIDLEICRALALFAAHSENTLQGIRTGTKKLERESAVLGISLPQIPFAMASHPIIRLQWMILNVARTPKPKGDPLKFSSLGNMFDAVGFREFSA